MRMLAAEARPGHALEEHKAETWVDNLAPDAQHQENLQSISPATASSTAVQQLLNVQLLIATPLWTFLAPSISPSRGEVLKPAIFFN